MTGPEHYIAAERLLKIAAGSTLGSEEERYDLAAAQVHATLALAAATVAAGALRMHPGSYQAWHAMTGEK